MRRAPFPFPFRTGFQYVLETREQLPELRALFRFLHGEGFYGVELNLPDLDLIRPEELLGLLEEYDLTMEFLATGAYARARRLSLSSADPAERRRAVEGCRRNIEYAARMRCGIILGFFKGGPGGDRREGERLFTASMAELKPYIEEKKVPVLLEATNRRETSVLTTLGDGARIVDRLDCPLIRLLADTYHMNIEEPSLLDSLQRYRSYYPHLHLSDSNRAFPGLGDMDFAAVFRKLAEIGYEGTVAIEGNIQNSLLDDIRVSAACLRDAGRSLRTAPSAPPRVAAPAQSL